MKQELRAFVAGAFGLIALYLALAHAGGLSQVIGAGTKGSATVFKTLQGRG